MSSPQPVTVIMLAAQRTGVVNPLAESAGVSHKCIVPICGRPLVEHVLDTITALPAIREIRISLEVEAHDAVRAIAAQFTDRNVPIRFVENDLNIVESVLKAAGDDEGPFIITTADNVLLTAEGFEQVRETLATADATISVTTREAVWAAHRQGQSGFYEFKDAGYANCNLYGVAGPRAFKAAEFFREGGQFQKNPKRLARAVGLFNILLMKLRLVTLPQGVARISKRMGVNIKPVIFADGSLAIDVDNERTYDCCETILKQRAAGEA
ncbi:MAG: NTP transferase domain-containing protein [Sphingomonadaceae bacterium]|nr:NTP transferase domain-containing protein [Sphingomonadaceae bacterium]